jgi:hypothetical protein
MDHPARKASDAVPAKFDQPFSLPFFAQLVRQTLSSLVVAIPMLFLDWKKLG